MKELKSFFAFLVERFTTPRNFFYPQEQLAYQRSQERRLVQYKAQYQAPYLGQMPTQSPPSAYFTCRHMRD